MRFLLSIPNLKILASIRIPPREKNELLRLALRLGNQCTCVLLLSIPEALALTHANSYYIHEAGSRLDLRALS